MTLAAPLHLVRPDLVGWTGYSSARTSYAAAGGSDAPDPSIWLNANEGAGAHLVDPEGRFRRYPDPQPAPLTQALAETYGVPADQVVVGRGSDELIDVLVRTLCRPGGDGVVVCTPTFGMYAISARLHGVPVTELPATDGQDTWHVDVDAVATATQAAAARVVFLASPGNPTGAIVPLEEVSRLAGAVHDQAVVVVDEAYAEFTTAPSTLALRSAHPNLVVLRTLSKAHALAAARIGCAVADPGLATVLRGVLPPYPLATPAVDLAVAALEPDRAAEMRRRAVALGADRRRLGEALARDPRVSAVYRSEANFVLIRCHAPQEVLTVLRGAGIVVRDMRQVAGLEDALRVTVGAPDEVDAVIETLAATTEGGTTPPVRET